MHNSDVPLSSRQNSLDRPAVGQVVVQPRRGILLRFAIAVGFTAAAFGLTLLLEPYLQRTVFLLFWPAIIGTAWLAGLGPAILTACASVALVDYFVIKPAYQWGPVDAAEIVTLVTFLLAAGLTSWAVAVVDRARQAASTAAAENAELARQLDEQAIELSQQLEESQAMSEELEQSAEELAERTGQAEEAERFARGILESISDPFVVQDSEWRFRYINDAAAALFSEADQRADQLIGTVVWDAYPHLKGTTIEKGMRRCMETRKPFAFEAFSPQRGRWSELFCYPLPDGGIGTQWKDITDRKRAEEASDYLSRATELLTSSADYETTLREVARLIVPQFADWCAISMLEADGKPRQLAVAHVDPEKVKWADELNKRYPPDNEARTGVPQVLRSGEPELYSEIPHELMHAGAIHDDHHRNSR
jgi:PAS domain S-box-containing protein